MKVQAHFFRTTTGIQSGPDNFDNRPVEYNSI